METPNYYAIITADVRYDNTLSSSEKLFYGEITALSSKTGKCWASNSYFSSLYNVSNSTVSSWVKKLQKRGYIEVFYEKKGKQITKRILKLRVQKTEQGYSKNLDTPIQKTEYPIQKTEGRYSENLKENNTRANNIKKNNIKKNNIKANSQTTITNSDHDQLLNIFSEIEI